MVAAEQLHRSEGGWGGPPNSWSPAEEIWTAFIQWGWQW